MTQIPAAAPAETAKMVTPAEFRLRVIAAIAETRAASWDACANPNLDAALHQVAEQTAPQEQYEQIQYNPFITYDFFHAVEASGSATARTDTRRDRGIRRNASSSSASASDNPSSWARLTNRSIRTSSAEYSR